MLPPAPAMQFESPRYPRISIPFTVFQFPRAGKSQGGARKEISVLPVPTLQALEERKSVLFVVVIQQTGKRFAEIRFNFKYTSKIRPHVPYNWPRMLIQR
jgi:hypothetical protein